MGRDAQRHQGPREGALWRERGIAGFSERTRRALGRTGGDFCGPSAAVLAIQRKSSLSPQGLRAFSALQVRRIDLLMRQTTWTLTREAVMKMEFPPRSSMTGRRSWSESVEGEVARRLERRDDRRRERNDGGGEPGRPVRRARPYVQAAGDRFGPWAAEALFDGRCQACTSDGSQLAAMRLRAPGVRRVT